MRLRERKAVVYMRHVRVLSNMLIVQEFLARKKDCADPGRLFFLGFAQRTLRSFEIHQVISVL